MERMNPRRLTLRQFMVLKGFDRIADLVRAADARGEPVPQPAVSEMMRGGNSYPKARAAVAAVLGIDTPRLLELLAESSAATRRRMTAT